jgi:NhaP-type Na+/H+ or K+/H+ antiporter
MQLVCVPNCINSEPSPDTFLLVLSGYAIVFFPGSSMSFDGNWFLRIMVPPIVFEAALSIDKRAFKRHIVPILLYAIFGTLIATGLTAFILHHGTSMLSGLCTQVPYAEALTFGALISSIDPIAVLSVLSNMGLTDTDTIYVVIFGESLLNDGVAIVLFQTLVHFLDENLIIDGEAMTAAVIHFLVVALGSLLIGLASGMLATVYYWLFDGCQTALVEVLMFFCWALLPYYVCDGIGWSGIVSAVATGFVMDIHVVGQKTTENETQNADKTNGRLDRRRIFGSVGHLCEESRTHIGFVMEIISTTMETAIFAYLGLFLFSHRYHWNFYHTIISILACCVSRSIMIPTLSFVANMITNRMQRNRQVCRQQQLDFKDNSTTPPGVVIDGRMQLVLWFAGLRGAMSFALVEHIPLYDSVSGEGTRMKPELKAMTSASILFTVFVLGGYTYYLMDYLGMSKTRKTGHEMTGLLDDNDTNEPSDTTIVDLGFQPSVELMDKKSPRQPPNKAFRRQRHQASGSDLTNETMNL